jgi:hypothetical protein
VNETDKSEFDPDTINRLLGVSADRIRDLEQAVMEAYRTMTMLAAALATVRQYLVESERDSPREQPGTGEPTPSEQE